MDTVVTRGMVMGIALALVAAVGCGSNDTETSDASMKIDAASQDAAASDARANSDADGWQVDGCDACPAGTICVACNCGGPASYTCEPVPEGCETDRTCACAGVADFCTGDRQGECQDVGEDAILCETGRD